MFEFLLFQNLAPNEKKKKRQHHLQPQVVLLVVGWSPLKMPKTNEDVKARLTVVGEESGGKAVHERRKKTDANAIGGGAGEPAEEPNPRTKAAEVRQWERGGATEGEIREGGRSYQDPGGKDICIV